MAFGYLSTAFFESDCAQGARYTSWPENLSLQLMAYAHVVDLTQDYGLWNERLTQEINSVIRDERKLT